MRRGPIVALAFVVGCADAEPPLPPLGSGDAAVLVAMPAEAYAGQEKYAADVLAYRLGLEARAYPLGALTVGTRVTVVEDGEIPPQSRFSDAWRWTTVKPADGRLKGKSVKVPRVQLQPVER